MQTNLIVLRYRKAFIPFAFFAMAIFHLPLLLNRSVKFYKLMGCGRNGSFDKIPDLQQWAILVVYSSTVNQENQNFKNRFIDGWIKFFKCEVCVLNLLPVKSHGTWDGKKPFPLQEVSSIDFPYIATLTRATIRLSKMKYFWKNVAPATASMLKADGFLFSLGVGEVPWIKQATFSIWKDEKSMVDFAYKSTIHANIIKKTKDQKWYSEDMFTRFRIAGITGTINGKQPLANDSVSL